MRFSPEAREKALAEGPGAPPSIQQVDGVHSYPYDHRESRPPLLSLTEFPIRRFVTTNYDEELERALVQAHSGSETEQTVYSFSQTNLDNLSIFSIALARSNRNMVFHCHGSLKEENSQGSQSRAIKRHAKPPKAWDWRFSNGPFHNHPHRRRLQLLVFIQSSGPIYVSAKFGGAIAFQSSVLRWVLD